MNIQNHVSNKHPKILSSDQAEWLWTFSTIFLLQSLWLFFLFKYYMSVVPVKYLHFRFRQKWNVDFTNGWNQGRPGSYLVNKLEIEESRDLAGDFEAFSTVSFSSFLAGYNWQKQLYINKTKTNNFQILSAFQID